MNIDIGILITVVGLAIESAILIVTAVWTLGRLNAKHESQCIRLSELLNHLATVVNSLTVSVEKLDNRIDSHEVRLTVLEKMGKQTKPPMPE